MYIILYYIYVYYIIYIIIIYIYIICYIYYYIIFYYVILCYMICYIYIYILYIFIIYSILYIYILLYTYYIIIYLKLYIYNCQNLHLASKAIAATSQRGAKPPMGRWLKLHQFIMQTPSILGKNNLQTNSYDDRFETIS